MVDFEVKFAVEDHSFDVEMGEITVVNSGGETYAGDYVVTPTKEVQTLETKGKIMREDVRIAAIPQNYGLITYDQKKIITVT